MNRIDSFRNEELIFRAFLSIFHFPINTSEFLFSFCISTKQKKKKSEKHLPGRMYSLGEVNFIQGMHDFGNPKNSVGLKPAKAQR